MAKYQKYAEYQDSGIEWLGKIPRHWTITSLKRFSFVKGGYAFSSDIFTSVGKPIIRIGDIQADGSISLENCKNIPLSIAENSQDYLVTNGQILMAMTGATIGKAGIFDNDEVAYLNQRVGKFIIDSNALDYGYLWYLLKTHGYQEYIRLTAFGGAQPNISDTAMVDFNTCIPALSEQVAIATFLDHETAKIDSLIAKQEKLIELLKEKRQAVISHAVTKGLNPDVAMKNSAVEWLGQVPEHWTIPQIGYHAEVTKLTGFEYTNLWMPTEEGEIIALRGFNIQERYLDLNKTERISTNLSNKLFRSKLFKGDLVLPCTGTLGNAALIENDDTFHINQNIAKVTFDKNLFVPEFCLYWVTSQPFRQMIDFNNTSGMQPVLLIGDIRKLPIPLCSRVEQIEIVNYLDHQTQRMGELIRKAESAIQLMQERRTALISSAVTGKIDVRNWQHPNEAKMEFSA